MTKKQKQNAQAYAKQIKRIKQFISRAEKRGYQFKPSIIPAKPKRITVASVRKLQKITPDVLYKHAVYGGEATYGEIVPAVEGRKAERRLAAQRARQTRKARQQVNQPKEIKTEQMSEIAFSNIVLSNFQYILSKCVFGEGYSLLVAWANTMIAENGRYNFALALENATNRGVILTTEVVYDIQKTIGFIDIVMDNFPEQGVLYKEQVMDRVQFLDIISEALEQEEDWEEPL